MKKTILLLLLSFISQIQAQVGINTNKPDKSAMLDVTSTEKGFLPPRLEQNDVDGMVDPATGLVIYNLTEKCVQVNIGTPTDVNWQCLNGDGSATASPVSITNGVCTLDPVQKDTTTAVVDLQSPETGRIWMDRNLGASGPYVQGEDSTYGHYYQYGRGADGHELLTSNTIPENAISHIPGHGDWIYEAPWTVVGGVCFEALWRDENSPCPDGYRIPTEAEVVAEFANLTSGTDRNNHWYNVLKIPPAGTRRPTSGTSTVLARGDLSNAYASSFFIKDPITNDLYATASNGRITAEPMQFVRFTSNNLTFSDQNGNRDGYAVRCIKAQ